MYSDGLMPVSVARGNKLFGRGYRKVEIYNIAEAFSTQALAMHRIGELQDSTLATKFNIGRFIQQGNCGMLSPRHTKLLATTVGLIGGTVDKIAIQLLTNGPNSMPQLLAGSSSEAAEAYDNICEVLRPFAEKGELWITPTTTFELPPSAPLETWKTDINGLKFYRLQKLTPRITMDL